MISVIERRLEMPDALELPRMLGAVVPHVRPGNAIVNEFVALAFRRAVRTFQILGTAARSFPGFAAIARSLNDLPEPTARLRRVNPVWINRRPFHVINLPAGKMRPVHFPIFALRIRSQDERAFPCANQKSNSAHKLFLLILVFVSGDDAHCRCEHDSSVSPIAVLPSLFPSHGSGAARL